MNNFINRNLVESLSVDMMGYVKSSKKENEHNRYVLKFIFEDGNFMVYEGSTVNNYVDTYFHNTYVIKSATIISNGKEMTHERTKAIIPGDIVRVTLPGFEPTPFISESYNEKVHK